VDARAGKQRLKDGLDLVPVLPFAKIGNELHKGMHTENLTHNRPGRHRPIATF
jgi:hypothetical protein